MAGKFGYDGIIWSFQRCHQYRNTKPPINRHTMLEIKRQLFCWLVASDGKLTTGGNTGHPFSPERRGRLEVLVLNGLNSIVWREDSGLQSWYLKQDVSACSPWENPPSLGSRLGIPEMLQVQNIQPAPRESRQIGGNQNAPLLRESTVGQRLDPTVPFSWNLSP